MSHYVTIEDALRNNRREDRGKFIAEKLPGHKCLPECHEIGGEPETPEMYNPFDDEEF